MLNSNNKLTRAISQFLLLVLIVNSSYLSYKYLQFYYWGGMLAAFDCADGCDTVMTSKFAMLFGIPVPVYGLAYFIVLTICYLNLKKVQKFFELLLVIGLASAFSFLYILYFVLHAHCKFCLLSHVTLIVFAALYFWSSRGER